MINQRERLCCVGILWVEIKGENPVLLRSFNVLCGLDLAELKLHLKEQRGLEFSYYLFVHDEWDICIIALFYNFLQKTPLANVTFNLRTMQ